MLFLLKLSVLVAFLCSSVFGRRIALVEVLARRQFDTLTTSCIGTACPKTSSTSISSKSSSKASSTSSSVSVSTSKAASSSSSVSKSSSASVTSSSRLSTVSSTKSTTASAGYNSLRLTTTFTQPPACTGGFTVIEDWGTNLYNNLIYSSPGYDLEFTSCYPPQFYSSILAAVASTTLGPFNALICPATWESNLINSTYVICCPSGYDLVAPNFDDPIRPGAGAACTSYIGAGALFDVTSFDLTGGEKVVGATADTEGTVVFALAFDGITTSVLNASTSSSSLVFTSTSLVSTTLSSKSSSSSAAVSSSKSTSSSAVISSSKSSTSSVAVSSSSSIKTSSSSASVSSSKASSSSLTTSSASLSKASSLSSSVKSTSATSTIKTSSSSSSTTTVTTIPGESALPACGQLCFNNMLAQYSTLGCNQLDSYCLCNNVNFGFGLRDCSNGACGTAVASTVIAFGSAYCSTASATHIAAPTAIPGESALPACGQLCFNNMLAQYSTLGCNQLDAFCLCSNVNFGFGLRDCSNGACGTDVASTVIAFGSSYCATATATHTGALVTAR